MATKRTWIAKMDDRGRAWEVVALDEPTLWVDAVPWEGSEADAHLISAAPDMLEVLKMISDADDDCRVDGLQTMPRTPRAALDAAIAKATGVR